MNRILEIDLANHVAVVEPGVTLAELDAALVPHGLRLPGVPRRAVGQPGRQRGHQRRRDAGGQVRRDPPPRAGHRGGARHRRGDHRRGQVREVDQRLRPDPAGHRIGGHPGPGHPGHPPAAPAARAPRHAAGAVRLHRARWPGRCPPSWPAGWARCWSSTSTWCRWPGSPPTPASTSGSPTTSRSEALAYLVIVLENHHEDRLEEDTEALAELIAELGALDVYVLPDQAGAAADRRPRTGLLGVQGRRRRRHRGRGRAPGLDPRLPRPRSAELAAATSSLVVGCGHAGDGNVHLSVWQSDPAVRGRLLHDIIAAGVGLGGAISGEHGIGTREAVVPGRAGGPGQARAHAPDQGGLRSPRASSIRAPSSIRCRSREPAR